MDKRVSKELAFLFYRQTQIAIAITVIKLTPPNMSIEEYAKEFQRQYRKSSKHYNLDLERSILTDQLLRLVSKQSNQLDVDNSFIALREECRFAVFKPLTAGSYDYLQRLNYVSRLFEAGLETEVLFSKNEEITHIDIYRILSKLDFSNTFNPTLNSYLKFCSGHTITSVALQVLKDSIESANFEYLFTSCIKDIFKMFKAYLNEMSEAKKDPEEVIMLIKKCNNTIVKCFERNSCYEKEVVNSVQELIRIVFDYKRNKYGRNLEHFCYLVIRKWKNQTLVCMNSLNVFVYLIKAYTYGDNGLHLNNIQEIENCRRLLTYTKSFLNAYCRKHLAQSNISLSDSDDSRESQLTFSEKNIQFHALTTADKQHFYLWSRTLATFSMKMNDSHLELAELAWQCIKIILLVGENKTFRRQYKDFIDSRI